jgi:DNA-directed RNA polymerase specialized sigma24 family protein
MTLRFAEVRTNDPDAASMRARCEERAAVSWRLTDGNPACPHDENAALDLLPAEHRAVVWRSYYLVWMTAQIADDRHIADGTVKSRLHCALLALRLTLQEMEVTR